MTIPAINPYLVGRLFPQSKPIKNINDMISEGKISSPSTALINDTLKFVHELESIAIALKTGVAIEQGDSGLNYSKYITPDNPAVKSLAREITSRGDTNDQKMFAIEQWVQEHIEYKTDIENYGQLERWAYPIETLNKQSGDCEDQAFLIHSLGLAAGVSPDSLRTYGGLVFDPSSTSPGGHGWTAYMREIDDKWVTMDSSYYPVSTALSERDTMSEDLRYIDDFWYIQASKTIATPYANKIRFAGELKGVNVNVMA